MEAIWVTAEMRPGGVDADSTLALHLMGGTTPCCHYRHGLRRRWRSHAVIDEQSVGAQPGARCRTVLGEPAVVGQV